MESKNFEPINEKENNGKNEFYSSLNKLLTEENVNRLCSFIESYLKLSKDIEIQKSTNEKEIQNIYLIGWKWRFSKEFSVILIICLLIFSLAYFNKIETSTTGTLVGSLIGYAIGRNHNNTSIQK